MLHGLFERYEPNGREIGGLTLLRGIGAMLIMMAHFNGHFSFDLATIPPVEPIFARGYFLVDVFFIISGFVLYYIYYARFAAGALNVADYTWRRFARIYPVHLVTLLAAVAIYWAGGLMGLNAEAGRQLSAFWANLFLVQSYGVLDDVLLNYPSWSISAEFFAYLLFPVLLWGLCKVPVRFAALAGAAFFLAYAAAGAFVVPQLTDGEWTLFRLHYEFGIARIVPSFVLGMGIARSVYGLKFTNYRLSVAVMLAAVGLAALSCYIATTEIILLSFAALIVALYLMPERKGVWKPLLYMGRLSYAIYMVHALVEIVGFKLIETLFGFGRGDVPLWFMLPLMAVTIVASMFVYHFVEGPGRRLLVNGLPRLRRKPARVPAE